MIMHDASARRAKQGQSIIEAMIAISILTVGFLGIATLLGRSFVVSRANTDEVTATYLASEGIEIMKNILDHDTYASSSSGAAWGTCGNACTTDGTYEVAYSSAVPSSDQSCISSGPALDFDAATGIYDYNGSAATKFTRCIGIGHNAYGNGQNEVTVTSTVEWEENGSLTSVTLEDNFYNWHP